MKKILLEIEEEGKEVSILAGNHIVAKVISCEDGLLVQTEDFDKVPEETQKRY